MREDIRVVLTNPAGSANDGASCRAMKTMGLRKLTIVGTGGALDVTEVKKMALHAFDLFEEATFVSGLAEALSDTQLAVAVTRRHGQRRNKKAIALTELPEEIRDRSGADIAVVFGNEEHGLTTEEVELCSARLTIPSSPDFPSLNLSQAVQVVAYELFRAGHGNSGKPPAREQIARRERIEELTDVVMDTLDHLGFFKNTDGHYTRQVFRDLFHRAALRSAEAEYLQRIFQKIRYMRASSSS